MGNNKIDKYLTKATQIELIIELVKSLNKGGNYNAGECVEYAFKQFEQIDKRLSDEFKF